MTYQLRYVKNESASSAQRVISVARLEFIRFSLNSDSHCNFKWREPGSYYLPFNVREIDHYEKRRFDGLGKHPVG
ncbi:hypothetical protein TNCV_624501 [Trichonephila clavipes]|nr:hypothetical protein TNCV_624501 [Trichonephila clavipes]